MKLVGIIKISIALLIDVYFLIRIFGEKIGFLLFVAISLYAWLGEYIGLIKNHAIHLKYLNNYEQSKLTRVKNTLVNTVKDVSHINIQGIKLYVIPSDEINAFSYGIHSIAVTRGTLNVCDEMTLNAVLSHEISHSIHLDSFFNRIIFGNIILIMVCLTVMSFLSVSLVWIIFLCIGSFGFFSFFVVKGVSYGIKGLFTLMQRMTIFIYQVVNGIISKHCEYRSDFYAVELGFGMSLIYFLQRFVQDHKAENISELLYSSHPPSYKRIHKIENKNNSNERKIEII